MPGSNFTRSVSPLSCYFITELHPASRMPLGAISFPRPASPRLFLLLPVLTAVANHSTGCLFLLVPLQGTWDSEKSAIQLEAAVKAALWTGEPSHTTFLFESWPRQLVVFQCLNILTFEWWNDLSVICYITPTSCHSFLIPGLVVNINTQQLQVQNWPYLKNPLEIEYPLKKNSWLPIQECCNNGGIMESCGCRKNGLSSAIPTKEESFFMKKHRLTQKGWYSSYISPRYLTQLELQRIAWHHFSLSLST